MGNNLSPLVRIELSCALLVLAVLFCQAEESGYGGYGGYGGASNPFASAGTSSRDTGLGVTYTASGIMKVKCDPKTNTFQGKKCNKEGFYFHGADDLFKNKNKYLLPTEDGERYNTPMLPTRTSKMDKAVLQSESNKWQKESKICQLLLSHETPWKDPQRVVCAEQAAIALRLKLIITKPGGRSDVDKKINARLYHIAKEMSILRKIALANSIKHSCRSFLKKGVIQKFEKQCDIGKKKGHATTENKLCHAKIKDKKRRCAKGKEKLKIAKNLMKNIIRLLMVDNPFPPANPMYGAQSATAVQQGGYGAQAGGGYGYGGYGAQAGGYGAQAGGYGRAASPRQLRLGFATPPYGQRMYIPEDQESYKPNPRLNDEMKKRIESNRGAKFDALILAFKGENKQMRRNYMDEVRNVIAKDKKVPADFRTMRKVTTFEYVKHDPSMAKEAQDSLGHTILVAMTTFNRFDNSKQGMQRPPNMYGFEGFRQNSRFLQVLRAIKDDNYDIKKLGVVAGVSGGCNANNGNKLKVRENDPDVKILKELIEKNKAELDRLFPQGIQIFHGKLTLELPRSPSMRRRLLMDVPSIVQRSQQQKKTFLKIQGKIPGIKEAEAAGNNAATADRLQQIQLLMANSIGKSMGGLGYMPPTMSSDQLLRKQMEEGGMYAIPRWANANYNGKEQMALDNQKRNIFKDNLGGIREDNALLLAYHCSAGENPDQEYEDPLRSKKENMNVRYRLMADVDDTTD
jgi:hypothetical protein